MKLALALLISTAALAQSPALTISDPQGYHWEAAAGMPALQLYPVSGTETQAFTWTPTGSTIHFTVCTSGVCASDKGIGLVTLSDVRLGTGN